MGYSCAIWNCSLRKCIRIWLMNITSVNLSELLDHVKNFNCSLHCFFVFFLSYWLFGLLDKFHNNVLLAEVEEHPFDVDKMVFMDWRDSHPDDNKVQKEKNSKLPTFLYAMPFSSNMIFLEETSLVARPGVPMDDIKERMVARLKHLSIRVTGIEEDEHCVIPMGGPLPVLPQQVIGIGGTGGMVHPSTGYMVARTLAAAPIVSNAIVEFLGSDKGVAGDELSAEVWKRLWPIQRRRQREFFCFGMDILLKQFAPDWGQALTLKKTVEDKIAKDGVIGIGITAGAVGLAVLGIVAAVAPEEPELYIELQYETLPAISFFDQRESYPYFFS